MNTPIVSREHVYECPRCARDLRSDVIPCGPEHAAWVQAAHRAKNPANDRTHYPGCWRYHRECAVAEIEQLASDMDEMAGLLDGRAEYMRQCTKTIKAALERLGFGV